MNEFARGWRVVLGGAFGMATGCSALPFYTLGLLIAPLSVRFGWSRAAISAVTLCTMVTNVLAVPWMGRAADRFGVRPVALLSLLGMSLAYLCFLGLTRSIATLYLAWILLTTLGAGTYPPIWTRGVAPWFDKSRGLAIGLMLLGSGISSVLAPPLVSAAIERGGLTAAFLCLALIPATVGVPVVYFLFPVAPPSSIPDQSGTLAAESLLDPGLAAVLRRRQFWALGMAILLGGGSIAAFVVHLIPMMSSLGGSRQLAVRLSSEMGLAIIAGRLITGILLDRFAVRFIGSVYFLLGSLALLALASGPSLSTLHVSVVILGLGSGAEVDLVAFAASRYFGLGHFGEICAWLFAFFAVGFGLAPAGAGALFDHFGNYHAALWIGSGCLLAASGLFSTLGRTPRMA